MPYCTIVKLQPWYTCGCVKCEGLYIHCGCWNQCASNRLCLKVFIYLLCDSFIFMKTKYNSTFYILDVLTHGNLNYAIVHIVYVKVLHIFKSTMWTATISVKADVFILLFLLLWVSSTVLLFKYNYLKRNKFNNHTIRECFLIVHFLLVSVWKILSMCLKGKVRICWDCLAVILRAPI